MDKDKRFIKVSWWERLTKGETGSCSDGQSHTQEIFNPIFFGGWGCVPSLLFDLRPNYGGGNKDNGDLIQKVPGIHCYTQCPQPCSGPLLTHASTRDSWTLTGKSGSISCGVTAPFSWVPVCTRFVGALQESVSPVLWKFCNQIPLASKVEFPGGSQSLCQILRFRYLLWVLELS